jgi:two-component system nitrogen regulation response regulator NtrX
LIPDLSFKEAKEYFEKRYLEQKLVENEGNISRTAEQIGLERSNLHRKIKTYGIELNK